MLMNGTPSLGTRSTWHSVQLSSNPTNHSLHEKLAAAKKEILKVSSAKRACETDIKDAKKVHLQEINQANSVIKTLEKGGKGLENDTHNLKQNLKEPSYHLS